MNRRVYFKVLAFVFLVFVFSFFVINIVSPNKAFSEGENRTLSQKPKFSFDRLLNGRYTKKYEKYTNDQFFAREKWINIKSSIDKILNKKEGNCTSSI